MGAAYSCFSDNKAAYLVDQHLQEQMSSDLAEELKKELATSRLKRNISKDDQTEPLPLQQSFTSNNRILWGRDRCSFSERFEVGKRLGKGAFAVTSIVKDRQTGVEYACKTIDKSKLKEPRLVEGVRLEVEIMLHLNGHPHIVTLVGCYEDDAEVHMVLELCCGGSLHDRIQETGLPYSEQHAAKLIRNIVLAVAHCQSLRVLHRDIKPENFLFASKEADSPIKAADFGLSVFLDRGEHVTQACGTPLYVAPEVLGGEGYSFPADIWSCGVILYRLLSGNYPFADAPSKLDHVYHCILRTSPDYEGRPWNKILREEPDNVLWPQISPLAKDCVKRMLCKDPARRATAVEVLKHGWLAMHGCAGDIPLFTPIIDRVREFASCNVLKKATLRHIAEHSEWPNFIGLKKIFQELDVDHSGGIDARDLMKIARKFPLPMISHDMQEPYYGLLVQHADTNHDGVVDFREFVTAAVSRLLVQDRSKLSAAFHHFDSDSDGFLSADEVRQAVGTLCGTDMGQLTALMAAEDSDGDGRLGFDEFCTMMVRREPLAPLPQPPMPRVRSLNRIWSMFAQTAQ